MKELKVGIPIAAAQKGLLISFGKELMKRGHQVFYLARDDNVKAVIQDLLPDKPEEHIDVKSSFSVPRGADVIEECLRREENYGEFFSMLTSYHRALGKGYLYNADNHPDIIKAWWSKEKKFGEILNDFYYYEYVIRKYSPNLILGFGHIKILSLLCRHENIPYVTITAPRFGRRYYWVDNEYEQNFKLFSLVIVELLRIVILYLPLIR